jgi:hypothetical protein
MQLFEAVREAFTNQTGFATLQQILDEVEKLRPFTEAEEAEILHHGKLQKIRPILRRKNAAGLPHALSIERMNGSGKKERLYKQRALFDTSDYRETSRDYLLRAARNVRKGVELSEEGEERYGKVIPVPASAKQLVLDMGV